MVRGKKQKNAWEENLIKFQLSILSINSMRYTECLKKKLTLAPTHPTTLNPTLSLNMHKNITNNTQQHQYQLPIPLQVMLTRLPQAICD